MNRAFLYPLLGSLLVAAAHAVPIHPAERSFLKRELRPGVIPDQGMTVRDRPVALFPGRAFDFVAEDGEVQAHFLLDRPRGKRKPRARMRLAIRDPDGALLALAVSADGGREVLVDQHGLVEGREPEGFPDIGETGYFTVPVPPRGGPHRLLIVPRVREGRRTNRWTGQVRVLGARFFDPVQVFEGLRDLADLHARRYQLLRDLDLRVRRRDPNIPPLDPEWRGVWHSKDTFEAHLEPSVRRHMDALNQLTFRSHLQKADPVRYLWEALSYFQEIYRHWHQAPVHSRESFLYAGGPDLYEYFDEVAQNFGAVRESYYRLAGLEEGAVTEPTGRPRLALRRLRTTLEYLFEQAELAVAAAEERAELAAGPRELTPADFRRAEKICRASRKLPAPPPVEPPRYRTGNPSRGPGIGSLGEVRGVGRAEGPSCTSCPPPRRPHRDVRRDRYEWERRHLAVYMDLVRGLVQHDLRLVRLWQSILEGRTLGVRRLRAPSWRPAAVEWLSREAGP